MDDLPDKHSGKNNANETKSNPSDTSSSPSKPGVSRRDFLKISGVSAAVAAGQPCQLSGTHG